MFLRSLFAAATLTLPTELWAQREATREALERTEEMLLARVEDGVLAPAELLPAIVVSVQPAFEESRAWYPTAALAALVRVFGTAGLRYCEGCMAPRTFVTSGRLEQAWGPASIADVSRLDESARGESPKARTAIWFDETHEGVSLRIVDLSTSRILLADNFDALLEERARSQRTHTLTRELMRRARRDSITQLFFDVVLYPSQHVSLDWTEQWGDTNTNLSGIALSLFDPVVGVGGVYYRALPDALNILVGVKVLVSVPTALVRGISGEDIDVVDRLLTAVGVVRIPFGSSNYALTLTASTNGRVGFGISLLNVSLLPVLP